MPKKKHTLNLKHFSGTSSSSSKLTNNGNPSENTGATVNEKLNELRKLEGKEAAAKKRELAESVNQRSVPPDVRGLLGLSESAPPKPKAGLRLRERLRTPGPAPPRSWVVQSAAARSAYGVWVTGGRVTGGRRLKRSADAGDRRRPDRLFRFDRLVKDGSSPPPEKGTGASNLVHLALKATAESWHLIDEEDYPALAEIPLRLRLQLLSYISFYGAPIDARELKALCQGSEQVHGLDLAGLIGHSKMRVKKLHQLIDGHRTSSAEVIESSVLDDWEADEAEPTLLPSPSISCFARLTHLCLSHPGPNTSWKEFLSFAKTIPQITHLSLSYWPRPTLTPNLTTTTVSSRTGDVSAGGSHYYSSLDEDMTEPAALLRQLSSCLLCLQWLDLEGCQSWIPALTRLATENSPIHIKIHDDGWADPTASPVSIFLSNWKNLSYLRFAQGWLPSLVGVQSLVQTDIVDSVILKDVVKYLSDAKDDAGPSGSLSQDALDVEKKKARIWVQTEGKCAVAALRINACRRADGAKPVIVDFGWVRRHVSAT